MTRSCCKNANSANTQSLTNNANQEPLLSVQKAFMRSYIRAANYCSYWLDKRFPQYDVLLPCYIQKIVEKLSLKMEALISDTPKYISILGCFIMSKFDSDADRIRKGISIWTTLRGDLNCFVAFLKSRMLSRDSTPRIVTTVTFTPFFVTSSLLPALFERCNLSFEKSNVQPNPRKSLLCYTLLQATS